MLAVTPSKREALKEIERRPKEGWLPLLVLGAILVLALALRLYRIDAQSIWYDEGWSIHLAQESASVALGQIGSAGHTHPPGYYMLLWAWVRVFGDGVWAVRGLSALLGTLTVWMTYRLGRTLFDWQTGLASAMLLAIAPAHIVYSQETRMYALLALCFAGLMLLVYRYVRDRDRWSAWHWAAMIAVEIVAIYTHYFAFFLVASMAAWLLVSLLREGKGRRFLFWLGSQVIVLIAFVPWLGVAIKRAATHVTEGATPPAVLSFVMQVWSFLLGGHIALYGREPLYARMTQVCLAVVLLLVAGLLARDKKRRAVIYLLLQGLVPLALIFLLMRIRPGFHPRYVLMLLVPLVVVVARGGVVLGRWRKLGVVVSACVACLWVATMGLAARALITDTYYDRDNARSTAAYLQERLQPGAVVLADNEDWALRYYLTDAGLKDLYLNVDQLPEDVMWQIEALLGGHSEAALVKWHQGESDKRGLLPYLLERSGTLVERYLLPGYTVYVYTLEREIAPFLSQDVDANFYPLRLMDVTVETWVPADEAVAVALTWRKEADLAYDYKVALSLVDQGGHDVARCDQMLRDAKGMGTRTWAVGQQVVSYYMLPLEAGTVPVDYILRVAVYREGEPEGLDLLDQAGAPAGKHYDLCHVDLAPARGLTDKEVDRESLGLRPMTGPSQVAEGLALTAYAIREGPIRTGERLEVLLEWQHTGGEYLADYGPCLRLVRDGRVLASGEAAPVYDSYPTSLWEPGEVVLDWRELLIPPEIAGGPASFDIKVWGEPAISLGQVEIEAVPRIFDMPTCQIEVDLALGEAELVGYDLEATELAAGQDFSLVLYWRALAQESRSYVVFAHLLSAEGKLIAQHDGPPAGGERPTTGWIAGEYIVDPHTLHWVDPDYRGPAVLEVGLYDPANGQRATTPQGDSRLLLPSSIIVR